MRGVVTLTIKSQYHYRIRFVYPRYEVDALVSISHAERIMRFLEFLRRHKLADEVFQGEERAYVVNVGPLLVSVLMRGWVWLGEADPRDLLLAGLLSPSVLMTSRRVVGGLDVAWKLLDDHKRAVCCVDLGGVCVLVYCHVTYALNVGLYKFLYFGIPVPRSVLEVASELLDRAPKFEIPLPEPRIEVSVAENRLEIAEKTTLPCVKTDSIGIFLLTLSRAMNLPLDPRLCLAHPGVKSWDDVLVVLRALRNHVDLDVVREALASGVSSLLPRLV